MLNWTDHPHPRIIRRDVSLEVMYHQKKLNQCDAELKDMKMMEACRQDEQGEPEVNCEMDEEDAFT